jgi:hypothetical protein
MKKMNHLCGTVQTRMGGFTLPTKHRGLGRAPLRRRIHVAEVRGQHEFMGKFVSGLRQFFRKIGNRWLTAKEKANRQLTNA